MRLTEPFRLTLDCGTDLGGKVKMTATLQGDHHGIPFLLSLFGSQKKKDDRQLELSYEPPKSEEQADPGNDVHVCERCRRPLYDEVADFCDDCENLRCPDCDEIEPDGYQDPDTGSNGFVCRSCGCRYGFVCTEPGCQRSAGKVGKCPEHQPEEKKKRTRKKKAKPPAEPELGAGELHQAEPELPAASKVHRPCSSCGDLTTNKGGLCDACFDKVEQTAGKRRGKR